MFVEELNQLINEIGKVLSQDVVSVTDTEKVLNLSTAIRNITEALKAGWIPNHG